MATRRKIRSVEDERTAPPRYPGRKNLRVGCGHVAIHDGAGDGDFAFHGCGFSMYSTLSDGGSLTGSIPGPFRLGDVINIDGILAGSSLGKGRAWVGSGRWDPQWYSGSLEFNSKAIRIRKKTPKRSRFCLETRFRMKGNLIGQTQNPLIGDDPPVWTYGVRGRGRVILDMASQPDPTYGRLWEVRRFVFCFEAPK